MKKPTTAQLNKAKTALDNGAKCSEIVETLNLKIPARALFYFLGSKFGINEICKIQKAHNPSKFKGKPGFKKYKKKDK
jgi:hypothetical protein